MANRGSEELRIWIFRQAPAVGIDVADFRIGFDDDSELAGRPEEFHRVRLVHDSGHAGRQTIRRAVVFGLWSASGSGPHRLGLRCEGRAALSPTTGSAPPARPRW